MPFSYTYVVDIVYYITFVLRRRPIIHHAYAAQVTQGMGLCACVKCNRVTIDRADDVYISDLVDSFTYNRLTVL